MKKVLFFLLLFTCLNSGVAQLIPNGSFEMSSIYPGSLGWVTIGAGSTAIDDWNILSSVDLISPFFWIASEGNYSIDMNSTEAGSIMQTLQTEVGETYEIAFDLAGSPTQADPIKTLRVSAAGQSMDYTFDVTGYSFTNMGWKTEVFSFVATEEETNLVFTSLVYGSSTGPALDNIRLLGAGCENVANGITSVEEDVMACEVEADGEISLTVVGGSGSFSYQWESNGDTLDNQTAVLTGLTEGMYNYTVTDLVNLCDVEGSVELIYTEKPECNIFNVQLPSSCDAGNGILALCLDDTDYTVEWSTGSTDTQATGLEPGEYTVSITSPEGCVSVCSTSLSALNSIGNYIWLDDNKDGIQDASESGIGGVAVSLYEVNTGYLSTTETDQNGYYLFDALEDGLYYIQLEIDLSAYAYTSKNAGDNTALDSDIDMETGASDPVFLFGSACNYDIDAGLTAISNPVTSSESSDNE